MEKIINSYLKTYLVGPIEKVASGDSGTGWRNKLIPDLESLRDKNGNPIYIFNPCAAESNKVGMEPAPFHKKLKGWIASGNNDLVAEYTNLIWRGKHSIETNESGEARLVSVLGDNDYVMNSNFIILRMEENDTPCGTFGEAYKAFENRIPIFILQTMSRDKYPVTLVGWTFASGGGFYNSQSELIEYLIKTYRLEVL